ncbi:hypothetical protein GJ744_003605 [Endocarpon pusillum]|uniref:Small ribosomal subunit protein mS38 n=1 Tax=Endocarpon pusillum TaxID=364733 RepID=A0A8H7DZB0_9EURO|nr:hypothetical protein GJ744_003605 [Endocarpon pusillum]
MLSTKSGMITSSLRRAVRSPNSPQSVSRPTTLSIAASFSSRSHQRRQSSSKPPIPPNDGPANVANPSVKTVATPRAKDATGHKRSGAESRLSRRKIPRARSEHAVDSKDEWAINLPSVPSTQHLDPKDVFVASFFSNHRPISVTSSVPLSAPEEVFQSIFASRKSSPKSKPGTAEVIYTLASVVQNLDSTIAQSQSEPQTQNQQQGQQDRSDLISAITQHNNPNSSNTSEPQHLDGASQQHLSLRIPNGIKLAIQQIARQIRPFNPPPPPQPISDAQIEAKEAENAAAAAAAEAEEQQAQQLEQQIARQDAPQRLRHSIINVHERARQRQANRFFTPHTTEMENPAYPSLLHRIEEGGEDDRIHYDPNASIMNQEELRRRPGRIREGPQAKSAGLRRRKLYAISVKRQRRLKMKKHKYKKLMRRTRTLRRKLDK